MFGEWVIRSVINFGTTGLSSIERAGTVMSATEVRAAKLTGALKTQEAQWLTNAAAAERAAKSHYRAIAMFSAGAAVVGAATIGYGIKQAADLQTSLVASKFSAPRMSPDAIRKIVMSVSGMTAQSATTIADEFSGVASSGIKDPALLKRVFPLFAQAADVGFLGPKHLDPKETVKQLAQFSHIFGVYKGKPLEDMVNSAIKMMYMQPEGLQAMLTQGRVFVGDAMSRGVSMDEIFRQYMLMGQTGFLKGRGGSGVENVMDYLAGAESLTNHMSAVRRSAFLDLDKHGKQSGVAGLQGGLFDNKGRLRFVDEKGNLHLEAAEKYLAQLSQHMDKGQFANDLVNAFGKQGRNFLGVALRPHTQEQMERNAKDWGLTASVSTQWAAFMNTFNGQWSRFGTNFKNVVIDIFTPILPVATKFLKSVADAFARFGDYLVANPSVGMLIAGSLAAVTVSFGAAAIGFGIASLTIPTSLARIATGVTGFSGAMAVDAATIGAESAVAAGGLGAVSKGILGLATVFSNPIVIALFGAAAGLLYGAHKDAKDGFNINDGRNLNYGLPAVSPALQTGVYHGLSARNIINSTRGQRYGKDFDDYRAQHTVNIHFYGPVSDPNAVTHAVKKGINDPRSKVRVSGPKIRTSPFMPFALSAQPH